MAGLVMQQWYGLADEALEDALYDSQALGGFAGIDLNRDPVPDATTLLHFRHWLERHDLTKALFDEVGSMLDVASGVVHTLTGTALSLG
jgi:IS5 family transposase